MDSKDNVRERFEALERQTEQWQQDTRMVERRRRWWRTLWRVAAVAALGLALAFPHTGQAKTFYCGAGDVQCLIDAINQANANGDKNTIRLAAGTYPLTKVDNDTEGPNGLPSITSALVITGAGATATSIERAGTRFGDPAFRLLHVAASGSLTLSKITLQNGVLSLPPGPAGGGIFNAGALTLTHCTLTNNTAATVGGGIYNTGILTGTDCLLTDNLGFYDGGALINNGGTVTLTTCTLMGNSGDSGGGISNYGTATLTNSTLTGNGSGFLGGGILNGGTLTVTNSTLTGNNGGNFGGGGIYNFSGGTVTLTNATLTDNTANSGGGINNNGGTVTLTNATLTDNTASRGGGILSPFGSTTFLQNTILALNTSFVPPSDEGPPDDCVGVVTSLGHNLIGDPTGCTITLQPSDLTGDPGLGDFTDNGRPGNGHFPLLKTSQAIDAGDDAACPRRDQIGQRRVNIPGVGTSRCDIGAIEFPGKDDRPHDKEDEHHDEEDEHHDKDRAAVTQTAQ